MVAYIPLNSHCFVLILLKITTQNMALKRLNHQFSLLPSEGETFSSENEAHLHCLLKVRSNNDDNNDQCRL